jgi:hypothetical protein
MPLYLTVKPWKCVRGAEVKIHVVLDLSAKWRSRPCLSVADNSDEIYLIESTERFDVAATLENCMRKLRGWHTRTLCPN